MCRWVFSLAAPVSVVLSKRYSGEMHALLINIPPTEAAVIVETLRECGFTTHETKATFNDGLEKDHSRRPDLIIAMIGDLHGDPSPLLDFAATQGLPVLGITSDKTYAAQYRGLTRTADLGSPSHFRAAVAAAMLNVNVEKRTARKQLPPNYERRH